MTDNNLPNDVQELHLVINNLINRNQELMQHLQSIEDPERTLLVVSHEEDTENKWIKILSMLYTAAFENRLVISDVKDRDGNKKVALCTAVEEENDSFYLFPLFTLEDVPADEPWSFPAPGGEWKTAGDLIETAIVSK